MESVVLSAPLKSSVPDVLAPLFWSQTALTIGPEPEGEGLLVGRNLKPLVATASSVKNFCEKTKKINWLHTVAGYSEIVCCSDLFVAIPKPGKLRDKIWDAIYEAHHLNWLLPTGQPELLTACLPTYWWERPYSNVCIAAVFDGDADANRQRLQKLKETPARYRALWVKPANSLEISDDGLDGIHWIIADTRDGGASPLPAVSMEWTDQIRAACYAKGVAFLHNRAADETSAAAVDGTDDPLAHPFTKKIKPASSTKLARTAKPDFVATAKIPSPVDISAAVDTTVIELPAIIGPDSCLVVADASEPEEPATASANSDLGVFVPEIVTASPFDVVGIDAQRARFGDLDAIVRKGLKAFVEAGLALREIRDDGLWREAGHSSFDAYCFTEFGFHENYANRISAHSGIALELSKGKSKFPTGQDGKPILPLNESQVRPLAKLKDQRQWLKAWKLSVKRASGMPTGAIVAQVVLELIAKDLPPKVSTPSRKARLKELIGQLRQAVDATSWDVVGEITTQLQSIV